MILLLLTPFLNILIYNLTEKAHRVLILIQMILFSFWPSFLPSAPITDGGYGIINFITLYLIAAYIRLYIPKWKSWLSKSKLTFIFLLFCGITFLSSIYPCLQGQAWDYCYLSNIVAAAAIFCVFIQLKNTRCFWINRISSTTLGVYLIHAIIYIQPLVYHKLMRVELFCNSYLQFLHFLICITIQFFACSAIDYLRQKLWKHTMGKYINHSKLAKRKFKYKKYIAAFIMK